MEELLRRGVISGTLIFLDSMLHMDPCLLEEKLTAVLDRISGKDGSIVLVYGDCTAHMLDLARKFRVGRVSAINCAQLLVGRERYRRLMHEEAFLVFPEWASKWEHVMKHELGLDRAVAHDLMGEHRGKLVYLDTGLVPIPKQQLQEFSAYTGLPWRVERVFLDTMLATLLAAQGESLKKKPAGEHS
jgi:hypothetical protein